MHGSGMWRRTGPKPLLTDRRKERKLVVLVHGRRARYSARRVGRLRGGATCRMRTG
jgi:hypothetical protein